MEEVTFIIIGGGIAGVSCAEILGYLCPNEKVILFTASPVIKAVTNIVPLSKMLAQFDVVEKNPESLTEFQPSLRIIHDPVVSLNSSEHFVTTVSGKMFKYKKLCICSGGIPNLISENDFVIGIRDTESIQNFQDRIKCARRIAIVGNGGIATECVYELTDVEVIWIIKDNHISAPFIDAGAAEFFQHKLLKGKEDGCEAKSFCKRKVYTVSKDGDIKGRGAALGPDWHADFNLQGSLLSKGKDVKVEYQCEVKKILKFHDCKPELQNSEPGWPVYVELTNGKIYGCDIIVSATGVIPNTTLSMVDDKVFELSIDGGIKVNEKMETNVEDIFAAGDVCTPSWDCAPHWFQMRLWTQAHQMGCYAAKTMVASLENETVMQDFCFEMFTHVTNFFGYRVVLLGLFNGQKLNNDYTCQVRVTPGVEYIKLVMKDGRMQGAVLIGDTDIEEMCENLILNQLDLSTIENDLLDPGIDIDDYFD
ncbi:pyridine nucleotide-disulfide oxidoreductase domain 1 [Lycorma delicatula]|uniref:pyridine nucleotide-disulfide oxidoreductase domain 1 n=1 Tax=Lycorma delicatula TaxID=130591 RepID=UPI003F5148BD